MKNPPDPSYDAAHADECCMSCGARLEEGEPGKCNRCGGDYNKGRKKTAIDWGARLRRLEERRGESIDTTLARATNEPTQISRGDTMLQIRNLAKQASAMPMAAPNLPAPNLPAPSFPAPSAPAGNANTMAELRQALSQSDKGAIGGGLGALLGSGTGALAGAGGAAGGVIGGLKGLFSDPGEDEEGNKRSRIMAALKGGLGGSALGAAGGLAAGLGGVAGGIGGGAAGGAAGKAIGKMAKDVAPIGLKTAQNIPRMARAAARRKVA